MQANEHTPMVVNAKAPTTLATADLGAEFDTSAAEEEKPLAHLTRVLWCFNTECPNRTFWVK
jgi:hypothetical protein